MSRKPRAVDEIDADDVALPEPIENPAIELISESKKKAIAATARKTIKTFHPDKGWIETEV
jgi:hypothetical protein